MLNEFRQLIRSRTRLMLSLVILPFFFTSALGGAQGGEGTIFSPTASVPMAFIDDDLSPVSGRVYQTLARSGNFDRLIQGYRTENAIAMLGTGRIYAAIIIPKGFQANLKNNQMGRIVAYVDDAEIGLSDSILANLQSALRDFNADLEIQPTKQEASSKIRIVEKGPSISGFGMGIAIVLAVVQIFATFYEIAGGMSRDREEGTYARLLLSKAGVGSLILGKTLYDLILNGARAMTVLGMAIFLYGANLRTDPATILVISLLLALITMGSGFLVSALRIGVRTVVILEFLLVLFLFSFSGFIIERELLRGYAATISSLLPWSYGIQALRSTTMMGRPLLELTNDLQAVGISILILYSLSYVFLNLSRERLAS